MSAIWSMIEAALDEAPRDPIDRLVAYIERRYGSHQADELTNWLLSNPNGDVQAHVRASYVDPEADKWAAKVAKSRNPDPPKKDEPKKGKADDSDRDPMYVDPDQAKAQAAATAATAASRPDRAGVKPNVDRPTGAGGTQTPRSKEFQAMGTAGAHQAQDQPSLVGGKAQAISQKIAKLQSLIDDNPRHPQKDKIERTIAKLRQMAQVKPDAVVPGNQPVPKTKETQELERLHSLVGDEKALDARVKAFLKKSGLPATDYAKAKSSLIKKIRDRIGELGRLGSSTVKQAQGMDPDKFFRQGGSKSDVEAQDTGTRWDPETRTFVKVGPEGGAPETSKQGTGTVKPKFRGTFIGQVAGWNAYTNDFEPDEPGVEVPKGGVPKKPSEFPDKATGAMGKAAIAVNPAKPGRKWRNEKDLIWAGDKHGWVTRTQFLSLAAQGLIRRKPKDQDPTTPDLSRHRVVSPVNPPSSRANIDNTTGRPIKPSK